MRQLAQQHAVSISTAQQVYRCLENRGVAEARPKSGYFVAPRAPVLPEPLLDLRIASRPAVLFTNVAGLAMGFALFSSNVTFPSSGRSN